jgi:hypothetical protein
MKKLGVCGDSFMVSMSFDENDLFNGYGCHFTEILAKKLNFDIVTFAKAGCSNQTIRLQIDEIIKEKPDIVIIGTTNPNRVELPIFDLCSDDLDYYSKLYNVDDGLYNIDYRNYPNISSEYHKFKDIEPRLASVTINESFFENEDRHFNKKDKKIFREWYKRFFDYNWKQQQDTWVISDGLRKLMYNNISFFCINEFLIQSDLDFFGDKIIVNDELNPWKYYTPGHNTKYWFHTGLEEQEILAENWYNFIKNKNNINNEKNYKLV